jgi:hypothetical protein
MRVLPMYQNTTTAFRSGPLICRGRLSAAFGSSVIHPLLDEGITPSEMFDEIFLVYIINGDV